MLTIESETSHFSNKNTEYYGYNNRLSRKYLFTVIRNLMFITNISNHLDYSLWL